MRRQFPRRGRILTRGRGQHRPTGTVVRNQVPQAQGMNGTQVRRGIGRPLTERPAYIRQEVEEKRRELQEKYRKEAAEAEEKRLRREKKKREEWLKRQEALVRPGHRLGTGRQPSMANMQRDLVEHQDAIDPDLQGYSYQQETDEQFRMLVQQGIQRDNDAEELDRKIDYFHQQACLQQLRETRKNKRREEHYGSVNPRRQADNLIDAQEPSSSTSNARSSGNPRRQPDFVQNASLTSNTNSSGNLRKPANFLGAAHSASPSNSNARDANQEMAGQILGSGDSVRVVSPISTSREPEVDHRERMRAARLRMQSQYNEEVRKAEQAKDEEPNNVAEGVERISLS